MKTIVKVLVFFVVALASGASAKAQSASPVYRPGDVVRVSVVFDGTEASKIGTVRVIGNAVESGPPKDQPNFTTNLDASSGKKLGPNTFEVDLPITDNMARGDYRITEIRAQISLSDNAGVWVNYDSPEFPALNFRIDNSKTLTKPTIKSVTQ